MSIVQTPNAPLLALVVVLIVGGIFVLLPKTAPSTSAPDSRGGLLVPTPSDSTVAQGPTGDSPPSSSSGDSVVVKRTKYPAAPEIRGITGYLNAEPGLNLEKLRGKVVLVDFWTYSCINCIRTLPHLNDWYSKYEDDGFVILGIHSPEFSFEKEKSNVQDAVDKYGIAYPVLQDNDFATWNAYNNRYWPAKYLVDADGFVRYTHFGEGEYDTTEKIIVQLLKERDAKAEMEQSAPLSENPDFAKIKTPEIYFGYQFIRQPFGNAQEPLPNQSVSFSFPFDHAFEPNLAYLEGDWEITPDFARLKSETGRIALAYTAKNVNIVAGSPSPATLRVNVDNAPVTAEMKGADATLGNGDYVTRVKDERLYNLVQGVDYSPHTIVFEISGAGFELYTFTFG